MITYAGVDVTPPSWHLDEVYQWWHGQRIEEFERPGYFQTGIQHLPVPMRPSGGPPRVGVLHWPTGASRWAVCHLTATGEQLAAIREAVGNPPAPRTLYFSDGAHPPVQTEMWLLSVRPICQHGTHELYLLTLVDDRWWWWQAGDQSAPGTATYWSQLIDGLFQRVGVTCNSFVHPNYEFPNMERWAVGAKPIPLLIDAACHTVGLRVVRSLNGEVTCQSYESAAAADAENWEAYKNEVLSGGRLAPVDIVRSLPAAVAVVFPGTSPATIIVTLASLNLPEFAGLSGVPGRVGQIVSDKTVAESVESRTVTANRAARDYYLWALALTDCTLRGLVARPITGLDWCQEWVHGPEQLVTRVMRSPFDDRARLTGGLPYQLPVVEDVDQVPSVPVVARLRFDSADGFVISNPADRVARVDQTAASNTTVGYVNLVNQKLGQGVKTVDRLGLTKWPGENTPSCILRAQQYWPYNLGYNPWVAVVTPEAAQEDPPDGDLVAHYIMAGAGLGVSHPTSPPGPTTNICFFGNDWAGFGAPVAWVTRNLTVKSYNGQPGFYSSELSPGLVQQGITATRAVKDANGATQTVTITGGIITGWTTMEPI